MDTNDEQFYVEPMRLTDAESYVYEAIATLEYLDRPVTRAEIAVVAELADEEIGRILGGLAAQRLIEEQPGGTGPEDEPAYRLVSKARTIALPDDEPGAV